MNIYIPVNTNIQIYQALREPVSRDLSWFNHQQTTNHFYCAEYRKLPAAKDYNANANLTLSCMREERQQVRCSPPPPPLALICAECHTLPTARDYTQDQIRNFHLRGKKCKRHNGVFSLPVCTRAVYRILPLTKPT